MDPVTLGMAKSFIKKRLGLETVDSSVGADILSATADENGVVAMAHKRDGSVEIAYPRLAGVEIVQRNVPGYLRLTEIGDRLAEDALTDDGRVPQWVLDNWATRMGTASSVPMKLVIIAGQSNATSADILPVAVEEPDARLQQYDATTGVFTQASAASAYLGTYFGRAWLEKYANQRIGIVPTARGETGFTTSSITPGTPAGYTYAANGTWDRTLSADPNNLAVRLVNQVQAALVAAGPGATIAGLVWSQGEGDSRALTQSQYADKLDDLFSYIRTSLSLPNLPIVIGDMLPERPLPPYSDIPEHWTEILAALEDTPRRVLNTAYAPGPKNMFKYNNGRIHWSAAGQRVRGYIFRDALFRARINVAASEPQPPRLMAIGRSGSAATITWQLPECRYTAFNLQTSVDEGATWVTETLANPCQTTFAKTVTASTPLWARARTVNDVGTSDYSIEVKA